MEEGVEEDFMVILLRGTVDVIVGDAVVQRPTAPASFGEMSVLGLSPRRSATIRASTICAVRILHRHHFATVCDHFPSEKEHFQKLAAAKIELMGTQVQT